MSALARRAAKQLSRSAAVVTKATSTSAPAVVQMAAPAVRAQPLGARSFSVFSNLRDTVTSKMEERNHAKQGAQ